MYRINHIGIVVKNIEQYVNDSIYPKINKIVIDPIQHSKMGLIKIGNNSTDIELIEPLNSKSTTYNYLKKTGGGYHHICYETNNEKALYFFLKKQNIKIIYGPVEALLFNNNKVVFGYTKNREIVEFLILHK